MNEVVGETVGAFSARPFASLVDYVSRAAAYCLIILTICCGSTESVDQNQNNDVFGARWRGVGILFRYGPFFGIFFPICADFGVDRSGFAPLNMYIHVLTPRGGTPRQFDE